MEVNQNLWNKELIVVNILKYRYCVNKSLDISDDRFAKKL